MPSSRFRSLVRRYLDLVAARGPAPPTAAEVRAQQAMRRASLRNWRWQLAREHASLSRPLRLYLTCLGATAPLAVVKAALGPGSLLQEEMELAPFLGTRDLLWLSQAAKWLLPYRNQLGEVVFARWCKYRTTAMLLLQRRLHTIRWGFMFDADLAQWRRASPGR
jgi:hypothetical protein